MRAPMRTQNWQKTGRIKNQDVKTLAEYLSLNWQNRQNIKTLA